MDMLMIGTREHADAIAAGRHPSVQTAMAWLAFSHLPEDMRSLAEPLYVAAWELIRRIPTDSTEMTSALNKLVEAKDWMVRAGIRSDHGRPGPVPRPAAVVDPPTFGKAQVPIRPDQKLIGPPHAHLDGTCTEACYEQADAPVARQRGCGWHEEGGYGYVWDCPDCTRVQS